MIMKGLILALLAFSASAKLGADFGPDWANNFQPSDLQCLKSTGLKFLIIRSWQKYGAMDVHAMESLRNANAAGFEFIDTYLFPCRTMDARTQVRQLVGNLTQTGAKYGRIWLDIELNPWPGCGFDNFTAESNCQFVADLVDELRAQKQDLGIYSTHWEWVQIFGNDTYCSNFTDVPLWYAHFDGVKSFSDYGKATFGGWKTPIIKQYIDLTRNTVCGLTIDQDYIPDADDET